MEQSVQDEVNEGRISAIPCQRGRKLSEGSHWKGNSLKPLVSVVVPAFNAAATLDRTLRSIADQTYSRLEIIIVDDGSSDDTPALARAFCSEDARGKFIRQSNAGVAAARNTGIKAASGDWVAPIDADDLWHPSKIERQVEAATRAASPPGFVYCWFHLIDEEDNVLGSSEAFCVRGEALDSLQYFNFVGNGSSLLIRRDAALEVGGYDSRLRQRGAQGCEDVAIQLRLASRYPVEAVCQYLVGYRCMAGSMSGDTAKMHRSWQLALQMFEEEGGRINRKCLRRNQAHRALREAERQSQAGAKLASASHLLRALRLDPSRTAAKLSHRLLRSARKVVGGRTSPAPKLPFALAPIDRPFRSPDEVSWLGEALFRWDQRRLASLARAF
jgi:GT2 family glycosyltransferase